MNSIFEYLDSVIKDPKCELIYSTPFEFLIAVVLSAQTTDKKVNMVCERLFKEYDINTLSKANINDLENILKPLGMSFKKAKYIKDIASIIIDKYSGKVPEEKEELITLPGVGNKSANVILSTLFNKPYMGVDTHVSRVTKRLGLVNENDDVLTIEKKLYKLVPKERINRTHHQLVLFGRYYCTANNPKCSMCKLNNICVYNKNESK